MFTDFFGDFKAVHKMNHTKSEVTITVNGNRKKVRILHVDDDESFLEVTKEILEAGGRYLIDGAISADEALKKVERQTYDVIISDYKMPDKNGLDLLRVLCIRGNTTPFILFTIKDNEGIADKVSNLGAFRYFCKSGNPETVYSELTAYIDETVKDRIRKPHTEFVTLPFTLLKHICKFEKGSYCELTKSNCSSKECPEIQKGK